MGMVESRARARLYLISEKLEEVSLHNLQVLPASTSTHTDTSGNLVMHHKRFENGEGACVVGEFWVLS